MNSKNKAAANTLGYAKKWYSEGIQFECQGSGKCCASHGEFGYVYFTNSDLKRVAKTMNISVTKFKELYATQVDKIWALKENPKGPDCIFLKKNRCEIYEGRPTQCRTWPFWPEVMNAKSWKKSVEAFCPGINKGRLYSALEIEKIILEQKNSTRDLITERISSS